MRAARGHIDTLGNAVLDHQGQERGGKQLCVGRIDTIASPDHKPYKVRQLLIVRCFQLSVAPHLVQPRGFQPDYFAGIGVPAAIEGKLQDPRHVEHRSIAPPQGLAGCRELHAAYDGVIDRIRRRDAPVELTGDDHLVVEDLRHATAEADHVGGGREKWLRAILVDADR